VRDGFEGIFDLVEAAFGREDGRLRLLLAIAMSSAGAALTLESYLRDMIAACSADSGQGGCVKKGRTERERVWRGAGVVFVRSSSRHKLPRVGVSKTWHRPLFDGEASHRQQRRRAASPRQLYRQPRHRKPE
jgi:hypothetical protein